MDKIKEMNLEQVELRSQEIATIVKGDTEFDVKELRSELAELSKRRDEIKVSVEERKALEQDVINNGNVISKKEDNKMEKREVAVHETVEYRNAFIKDLMGVELSTEERSVYEEQKEVEKRAGFVHSTGNTAAVLPKELENKIYSNMEEQHPILRDVQILRSGIVLSIVKHTAIVAGDAKVVAEGVANDDEQNTFVEVVLAGKKFSKHVDVTYELGAMSLPVFESYLIDEITSRIGAAMAKDIVDTIRTGANGLAEENKFAAAVPGTLDLADVLKGFGLLKGASQTVVYTNPNTFYTGVATMAGKEGLVSFIPNPVEKISGQLLGRSVKFEDSLADGELLVIDPKQFKYNIVKDITIETAKDIKKGVTTIAGHALAGGSMTNDKAGVIITIGSAA